MTDIASIIQELEQRGTAIENAIAALRGMAGEPMKRGPGRPKGSSSSDGRERQAEAMRRYWASRKAGGKTAKKGGLTAEGRKALSENMKRLWAEKKLGKKRA